MRIKQGLSFSLFNVRRDGTEKVLYFVVGLLCCHLYDFNDD